MFYELYVVIILIKVAMLSGQKYDYIVFRYVNCSYYSEEY
jgi:hypothetical protein